MTAVMTTAVMATVGTLGMLTRWLDVRGLVPTLQSLLPMFGCAVVLALVVAVVLRSWSLSLVIAVPALVAIALAVPTLIPHTVHSQPGDEVIMTSNMEFGAASATSIVSAVRARGVQTLVLVEVTPDAISRLDRAGLNGLLPHRVGQTRTDFRGTLILSSHRLTAQSAPVVGDGALMPVARVHTCAGDYVLRGVHTYAPLPQIVRKWHADLDGLRAWRATQPSSTPVIVTGDFNASSAMPVFRRMAEGMTDAQRATGSGWVRTWPNGKSPLPAFVALDHVLVRGFEVVASGTVTIRETDHRAVWARVRLG